MRSPASITSSSTRSDENACHYWNGRQDGVIIALEDLQEFDTSIQEKPL